MKISIPVKHKLFVVAYVLLAMFFSTKTVIAQKEAEKIKNYLQANAGKHHLSGNDIQEMSISSAYLSPTTGWYHVYYNQVYQSIEVYNGVLNATLVNDKVAHVGNNFVENIAAKVPLGIMGSQLSPLNAVNKAAGYLGLGQNMVNTKEESIMRLANGQVSKAVFSNTELSDEAIPVKLYWYAHTSTENKLSTTNMHLVWSVEIYSKDRKNYWVTQVDAASGEVLAVNDQVLKCSFEHTGQTPHQHTINNTSTPSQTVTPFAANSYNVFDYPIESPIHGSRTIVTNPYTKFAPSGTGPGSTNGWHDDGVATYTTTRGNNVYASDDINGDNQNTSGTSPVSATLEFDYPYAKGLGDNVVYENRNAAITNLFYWNNLLHDVLWKYGFDEPSGNFQKNNMGRGGLANDYVIADAQDSRVINNSYFFTGVDGVNGKMEMFLWSGVAGDRPDSDFDNGIISHEYGHGWSTRLTGGPATNTCLNNYEQGGEGWSDYLALMLTTQWSTLTPTVASANIGRGVGNYLLGQATTGPGLRTSYYSYDMHSLNSNVTYNLVSSTTNKQQVGTIWATMLWDMTWEIIFQDNQIVNDIYNTTTMAGNVAALKLVNEGLRLQKCNPSFIDSRNAILKADSMLFNGRYSCAIWKAFARRGLGVDAHSGVSSNDGFVTEGFTPVTNNGQVFSSPKEAIICSNSVFNYTATVAGSDTTKFSWTRAAVAGISNVSKSGNTAIISETLINTTNNPIVVTYKFYLTPTSCQVPIDVKVVVNPAPKITLANYEVCKDGTVPTGQGLVAANQPYTNTVSGILNRASPTYQRGLGNHYITYISGSTVFYHTHTFVAPASETVSIEVVAASFSGLNPHDSYLTLYQTAFYPSNPEINFLMGDDDSGVLQYASEITYDLVAGTTYILVAAGYSMDMVGSYQIQATADIFGGPKTWYGSSSGGLALATGNVFNPVGVAGSGIAGTGTPLTKTFYLESSPFGCRTPATFTVNSPSSSGTITGIATVCNDLNKGKITLSGYSRSIVRWESSTNGFNNITHIADTSATIIYNNLNQTTQYRAVVKNGACGVVNSAVVSITRSNVTLPLLSNYEICQNSAIAIGSGLTVPSNTYSNVLSGTISSSSPTFTRGLGDHATAYAPSGVGGDAVFYQTHVFVAPASGNVVIETVGGTMVSPYNAPHDTYMALYHTSFNPADPATNFMYGDDDSGLSYASIVEGYLVAGTTYILVVSGPLNGITGGYELEATSNVFGGNEVKWYNYSSGGTPLATGSIFNPIGVPGSGILNTNSVITKTFFVESPDSPFCRIPAVVTIKQNTVAGKITGNTTFCSNTNAGTLTLSGHIGSVMQWEYSTDNFASATTIPIPTTSLAYNNVSQTTHYRALVKSVGCDAVYTPKVMLMRANSTETATSYNTCKDAIVPVGQGLVNTTPGYTNTVSGTFIAGSPTYWRGMGNDLRVYTQLPIHFGGDKSYYQTHTFTPTTTGTVSIEVIEAELTWIYPTDTYMAIYQDSFDPDSPATNFIICNDNSGALPLASKITDILTAGTTYVLVVTPFGNLVTGTYKVQASANIFGNPTNWYADPSGGTVLATGNIFNPVGVAGSGIANTATPMTKTFYTGFPASGTCLAAATFTVNTNYTPSTTGNTRCSPGTSILTATGCTGGTVNWYSGMSGGAAIATGTNFTTPSISATTTYYASCVTGVCESVRIPAVAVIGLANASYTTSQTTGTYQVSQTITSSANVATGVNYFAGKAIILTPGFQAGGSEVFSAKIQDCL